MGLVVTAVVILLNRYYLPKAIAKNRRWRQIVIKSLYGPFLFYTWLIVITLVAEVFAAKVGFSNDFMSAISSTRRFLTLVFLLWFLFRFIRLWERSFVTSIENGIKKTFQDSTSVHAMAQLLRIIAILIILLMLLKSFGIPISTLLTFGGIGGLAIGFAAKDTLANFIGGLMVYWDRPFNVGDWVRSPDRNIEGTVLNIGWRLTMIRTFDKRPLYVPNSAFSTISVENPSRMLNRRIKTVIGVRYDDATSVAGIVKDIENMLREHPEIDTTQTLFVKLIEFGSSALNILIYTFTKTTDWVKFQTVQEDVFLKMIDIVASHGAQFAFPTSTVHIPQGLDCFQSTENNEDVHD